MPEPAPYKIGNEMSILPDRIILPRLTDDQVAYLRKIFESSGRFDPNFMVTGHKPYPPEAPASRWSDEPDV